MSVLAVADSDSYLKWAAATLDSLGSSRSASDELVLLSSPVLPSRAQIASATAGTRASAVPLELLTLRALQRRLVHEPPDVLLVACTGPAAVVVLAAVHRLGRRAGYRPAVVTGLPGMSLPASPKAVRLRVGSDAFVVHSRAERAAFAPLVDELTPRTEIVLAPLPFLDRTRAADAEPGVPAAIGSQAAGAHAPVRRVVFAPQAIVPAGRRDRERVLDGLEALADRGLEVVVKLRGRAGERQTHDEAWPYDALADSRPRRGIRFETGPLARWLAPGSALVTVSSTAALESLARGLPTVLLDDFGVGDALLNASFAGSGCLASLASVGALLGSGGPVPDAAWLAENALHPEPSELPAAIGRLGSAARSGNLDVPGRVRSPSLRTRVRLIVPAPAGRRVGGHVAASR